MNEIWKDISGYEGLYQVSNWGNVKSLNYRHTGREHNLTPNISSRGYLTVTLSRGRDKDSPRINRLIAMAFIPIPERLLEYSLEELDVHHKDYDPCNNRVDNLEWLTKEEHRELHSERGRSDQSKNVGCSKRKNNI